MDHYEHPESREYSEPRAQGHHDHNDDGVTPLTPVPRFFVLGDSNGDATRSRRIRPPIHHDPVSKMIQRN